MAFSDSKFLFEIHIKSLKSYILENKFRIGLEFGEVFNMTTVNPNYAISNRKVKQKCKARKGNTIIKKENGNTQWKHTITVARSPSSLLLDMNKYPLKLYITREKKYPEIKLGYTAIPWNEVYMNYINHISKNINKPEPAHSVGTFNICNNALSRHICTVKMSIRLTYVNNTVHSSLLSNNTPKDHSLIHKTVVDEKVEDNINLTSSLAHKNITFTSLQSITDHVVKSNSKLTSDQSKTNKTQSCSSIHDKKNETFKYIFGDPMARHDNKVYHVGYFFVKKDTSNSNSLKSENDNSERSNKRNKFSYNLGDAGQIEFIKCKDIDCDNRSHRILPQPNNERTLLNFDSIRNDCCGKSIIEELIGGVRAEMQISENPCFCTCECTFGFIKETTYCNVCGGYELAGDDLHQKIPIPCPLYHKMIDKNKLKTWSTSGSESRKKDLKTSSSQKTTVSNKRPTVNDKKSVESEKGSTKFQKKKRDDRFKFNYGYKAPQIGHSKCALPCLGTLDNVPKNMGWLWTAENIPGIKFRPTWKPGATSKHVVRLLKIARNPGEVLSKKKRKDTSKKKRPLKRPLLIVHKKDGEFTVTMETMKKYLKPRAINQQPYEDKPVITYTIGRTEEENRDRLKRKERERRRLEREQRQFIQSTFRDMCHEICLKTYQQALGILPDAEDPQCLCYPAVPTPKSTNMNISCSCSEESGSVGSDTDSDEWIVEFTPPNALFDPSYKGKKVFKSDNSTQYSYLDYRVKLVDRFGNPVPRFFKGPDGKQQCSDLGGFWSPERKWLEINIDGYIAPDGRWAPNNFTGPNGEQVDAETGKFQTMNGKWLIVGLDGYIDCHGKWKYYPNAIGSSKKKRRVHDYNKSKQSEKKYEKSETSWSCLGDVSPKQLSKLGIVGHGEDRKLLMSTLQDMLAHGEDVNIPQPKTVFHLPSSKKAKKLYAKENIKHGININNNTCQHTLPSNKGVLAVDAYGNKTFFKFKSRKNVRPKERLANIAEQGISLSSFHVPCFQSFINSEVMKQQQRRRLLALAGKNIATQVP